MKPLSAAERRLVLYAIRNAILWDKSLIDSYGRTPDRDWMPFVSDLRRTVARLRRLEDKLQKEE